MMENSKPTTQEIVNSRLDRWVQIRDISLKNKKNIYDQTSGEFDDYTYSPSQEELEKIHQYHKEACQILYDN